MVTDLLIAGLLLASSAGLPPTVVPPGGTQVAPTEARAELPSCAHSDAADRAAMLEAHAGYAALSPFSLARIAPVAAPKSAPEGKGDPGCKS